MARANTEITLLFQLVDTAFGYSAGSRSYFFREFLQHFRVLQTMGHHFLSLCNGDFQTQKYVLVSSVFIWLKEGTNELGATFVHTCRTLQSIKFWEFVECLNSCWLLR